jgi:hypothetical protein
MSIRECDQCSFIKANGERCKNRTCTTHPFCWQHLKKEHGLRVKPSTIAGAGHGLYTTRDIKNNSKIASYTGDILTKEQLQQRYPGNTLGAYTLMQHGNKYVDARSTQTAVGRYANACDKPGSRVRCNAKLTKAATLKSVKKIKAGDEVFVPYGRDYWKSAGVKGKTGVKVKR